MRSSTEQMVERMVQDEAEITKEAEMEWSVGWQKRQNV